MCSGDFLSHVMLSHRGDRLASECKQEALRCITASVYLLGYSGRGAKGPLLLCPSVCVIRLKMVSEGGGRVVQPPCRSPKLVAVPVWILF